MASGRVTFLKKVLGVCHQYQRPNPGAQVSKLGAQLLLYPFTLALQRLSDQSQRWALICSVYTSRTQGCLSSGCKSRMWLAVQWTSQALEAYVKCYGTCLPQRGPDPWAGTEVALGCVTGSG